MHGRAVAVVVACAIVVGAGSNAFAGAGAKPPGPKPPVKPPAPKGAPVAPTGPKGSKPAPFIAHIESNPVLVARLTPLLPPGMTLESAATGFKNEGQFLAALHAAHNLNLSFTDLKTDLTGEPHESLGQAIHELKPAVDSKEAAKLAQFEGKVDIEESKENASDNHDSVPLKSGPFIKKLQGNTALVTLLTPLLPPGMTLAQAATGFHSEREFIAALHAAHNLNIPFAQIKAEMTGKDHDPLAVAIFEQKSTVDPLVEAKKAQDQARADIQSTEPKPPDTKASTR